MNTRRQTTAAFSILLAISLTLSVVMVRYVDRARGDATLQDVMYIPSATALKRMSLGYSGLLADIYWTRAVQYFGGKHHEHSKEYLLLAPLLDITTTLDPHLLPAYEFGSIFLSQKPPEGAGDPKAAADLVLRGIRENPEAWRLWYHLGFIYYQEMNDPKRASEAFLEGSKVPGAHPWMKIMAAALAQHAGEAQTAWYLWSNILNSTQDPAIRANAVNRLRALQVDRDVPALQEFVDRVAQQTGHVPASFRQLVAGGWMKRIPIDPLGNPYQLRDGHVEVADPEGLPFITKGLPPGVKASDKP
jgi:hypothetical protein